MTDEIDMLKTKVSDQIVTETENNISQLIIDLCTDISKNFSNRNLFGAIQKMIQIVDSISNFQQRPNKTPDQERMLNEAKVRGDNFLKNLLNNIAKYNPTLIVFAYELRMADK